MEPREVEITKETPLFPDLAEAWRYRWMAFALTRRNVLTRYTQTLLGPLWFILQPLLLTGVLSVVMGRILRAPSDGVPYILFAGTGTVLWTIFNRSINEASVSLVTVSGIFSKVYFPRLLVPATAIMTAAVDFTPVYLILTAVVVASGYFPGWPILCCPIFVLLALLGAFSAGLWLTVIDAYYRDIRLAIPYLLQLAFYFSPVMYASSAIPDEWRVLFKMNPLTGLVNGFRWSLVAGAPPPSAFEISWVIGVIGVGLVGGLVFFARFERVVVDRI
jgi:lipopolysaccharide transport system permease protein